MTGKWDEAAASVDKSMLDWGWDFHLENQNFGGAGVGFDDSCAFLPTQDIL